MASTSSRVAKSIVLLSSAACLASCGSGDRGGTGGAGSVLYIEEAEHPGRMKVVADLFTGSPELFLRFEPSVERDPMFGLKLDPEDSRTLFREERLDVTTRPVFSWSEDPDHTCEVSSLWLRDLSTDEPLLSVGLTACPAVTANVRGQFWTACRDEEGTEDPSFASPACQSAADELGMGPVL